MQEESVFGKKKNKSSNIHNSESFFENVRKKRNGKFLNWYLRLWSDFSGRGKKTKFPVSSYYHFYG